MSASLAATSPNPWERILAALEKKVNRHSYDTWLKPLRYSEIRGATLFVRVPAPEFREMGERYADLIREAIENLELEVKDVEFITADSPAAATAIRHNGGFTPPAAGPAPQQSRFDFDSAAQLNQRYTFDAFRHRRW
jgi:chromosomal replication initiator protein